MKRLFLLSAISLLAASCGISPYVIDMDIRTASPSGLELAGKSMAVVYPEVDGADSIYNISVSQQLAFALEANYFDADEVGIFSVDDSFRLVKDSLVSLVMQTGFDVVFLLDKSSIQSMDGKKTLVNRMGVYDSMSESDKMFLSSVNTQLSDSLITSREALQAAVNLALPYEDTWKTEPFTIYSLDSGSSLWEDALYAVYSGNWSEASAIWMHLAQRGPKRGRGAACYNMAVALYLGGDNALALEWLDMADQLADLPNSQSMRKRIEARTTKR